MIFWPEKFLCLKVSESEVCLLVPIDWKWMAVGVMEEWGGECFHFILLLSFRFHSGFIYIINEVLKWLVIYN